VIPLKKDWRRNFVTIVGFAQQLCHSRAGTLSQGPVFAQFWRNNFVSLQKEREKG
jgi:hypothetical protein